MNQKGVAPLILVLLAAVGIIVFMVASNALSFRDTLFGNLYPKEESMAAAKPPQSRSYDNTRKAVDTLQNVPVITNRAGLDKAIEQINRVDVATVSSDLQTLEQESSF